MKIRKKMKIKKKMKIRTNMQMKIALLTVCLVSLVSTSVFAATFKDVKSNDWFYGPVMDIAAKGAIKGYSDGTFKPNKTMTNAEALSVIISLRGIPQEAKTTSHWASGTANAGLRYGIVPKGFIFDYEINRLDMVNMIVKAMDIKPAPESEEWYLVFEDAFGKDMVGVGALYSKGVIAGSLKDGKRYFNPYSSITRAEVATILNNLLKKDLIPTISMADQLKQNGIEQVDVTPYVRSNDPKYAWLKTGNDLIQPIDKAYPADPQTVDDFLKVLGANLEKTRIADTDKIYKPNSASGFDVVIPNGKLTDAKYTNLCKAAEIMNIYYAEYLAQYNTYLASAQSLGVGKGYVITFGFEAEEGCITKNNEFFLETERWVRDMVDKGKLRPDMTTYEKGCYISEYISSHVTYKLSGYGYSGYGPVLQGEASCQGFTSVFNLMMRMAGERVYGISTPILGLGSNDVGHAWSKVNQEGTWLHWDATFNNTDMGGMDEFRPNIAGVTTEKRLEFDSRVSSIEPIYIILETK